MSTWQTLSRISLAIFLFAIGWTSASSMADRTFRRFLLGLVSCFALGAALAVIRG